MLQHKSLDLIVAALFIIGVAFSVTPVNPVYAGAPFQPELISPANGSPASSNPPTLCAKNNGDPDGDSVQIRFEVHGGGEGDHISPWMDAGGVGNVVCWTDSGTWTAQSHAWQVRAMDSRGDQAGATPEWSVNIPAPPPAAPTCTIDTLSVNPTAPQTVGTIVAITASASCTNGVQALRFTVNGNEIQTVNSSSATVSWNTSGFSATDHVINVEAADNVGGYIQTRSHTYTLTPGAPPTPIPVSCSVNSFSVSPGSPQNLGTQVTISGSGACSTGVRAIRIKVDGGIIGEIGSTSISVSWNTSGGPTGNHTIQIEVAGIGDDNWSQAASQSTSFTLNSVVPTSTPAPVNQAPYQPTLSSPANGATTSNNTPSLCAVNNGDPDGDAVSIRFEVTGGGEGDKISDWLPAGAVGNTVCWTTPPLSSQTHAWAARAVDSKGAQAGATAQWGINILPTPVTATCTVDYLDTNPKRPQDVGTTITISASATCTNGVQALRFTVGSTVLNTVNASSGTAIWNTTGFNATDYVIVVEAADTKAGYIGYRSLTFTLTMPGVSVNNNGVTTAVDQLGLKTGAVVQGSGPDIFVIHNGQRRLVPNPATLDALGITRSQIKTLTDEQLNSVPHGSDIPDVNRDPSGFMVFKNEVFPNNQPIVPDSSIGNNNQAQPDSTGAGGGDNSSEQSAGNNNQTQSDSTGAGGGDSWSEQSTGNSSQPSESTMSSATTPSNFLEGVRALNDSELAGAFGNLLDAAGAVGSASELQGLPPDVLSKVTPISAIYGVTTTGSQGIQCFYDPQRKSDKPCVKFLLGTSGVLVTAAVLVSGAAVASPLGVGLLVLGTGVSVLSLLADKVLK